jgi:hypothetical protein
MRNNVRCRSGLKGWQGRLREVYSDYEEFRGYAESYGLHLSLGYKTPENAWRANPVVQGSVSPGDYCKVVKGRRVFFALRSAFAGSV